MHTWGRILVRGRPLSKEPSNALAAPGSARCGLLPTSKTWIVGYVCVEYICASPCQNRLLYMSADMWRLLWRDDDGTGSVINMDVINQPNRIEPQKSLIFWLVDLYRLKVSILSSGNCKSLPFFYFLIFEKGRLLYIRPVGRLVGRSVGRSVGWRHH